MQELKPCPCCGSSNGLYVLQDEKYGEWSVFCDMCKTSFHNENHCDTREEAISAWNRRAERTCRIVLMDMAGNPPYRTGDWILDALSDGCSECGYPFGTLNKGKPNYCPHCGARVIEEES